LRVYIKTAFGFELFLSFSSIALGLEKLDINCSKKHKTVMFSEIKAKIT
jgi:hypothetical protein